MCLNPLRIKNPSRTFEDGVSHTFLTVRCNHCHECQKQNEDDWFVRSFYEWQNVRKNKGHVYFVLLTYNEDYVPHYYDSELGFDCPCFDPSHIKHFRDQLRMKLIKDGMPHRGIKFKIYAEFGGDKGRPHFHALIYVPYAHDTRYFTGRFNHRTRQVEGSAFKYAWKYGFVSYSKKHGPTIKGVGGIQYAQKYVNKEDKWTIKYCIPSYLQRLNDLMHGCASRDDYEAMKEKIRAFKRVMPRHFTSIGFGDDIINEFRLEDGSFDIDALVEGHIDLSKFKMGKPKNPNWKYTIPLSIMRKICYTCTDGLWSRNQTGIDVAIERHERSKFFTKLTYEPYFDLQKAKDHILPYIPDVFEDVRDDYDLNFDIKEIKRIMNGRSIDDLVMFSKVWSGVPLAYDLDEGVILNYSERYAHEGLCYNMDDKEHNFFVAATKDMDDETMMEFFRRCEYEKLIDQLSPNREPDPEHCARCHRPGFTRKRTTYGDFSCFRGFDDVLMIIDKWERLLKGCQQHAHSVEKERIDKILALNGSGWICEGEL